MILSCPNCDTQYFAEDATIGQSGREVKCASCGHSWHARPERAGFGGAAGSGAHETYRAQLRRRRKRTVRFVAIGVWAAMLGLAGVAVAGAAIYRSEVVERWPQSASAYQIFGFKVNRFGLDFVHSDAERYFEGTMPVLQVDGEIENISARARETRPVRILLLNDKGERLAETRAAPDAQSLAPGARTRFSTRIDNPPYEAFQLEFRFADGGPPAETGRIMAADADDGTP